MDLVRFEIQIPLALRLRLAALAARERRSASAEAVVAIARHLAAQPSAMPSDRSLRMAGNGDAAFTPNATAPSSSAPAGYDHPAGASPKATP